MTPEDLDSIRAYRLDGRTPGKIVLAQGKQAIGERLSLFCGQLQKEMPDVTIKRDSDIPFGDPVMVIGRHANIAYYTLPTGKFLPLFLDALDTGQEADLPSAGETETAASPLDLPAGLKLYVADQCPHCPGMLGQIQALANTTPMIRLQVINAALFPEMAQADKIKSVPTLILDDRFRWTGRVDAAEVLNICANRNPADLSADSLRQLIEDGQAAQVAEMMMESGQVFPALIDLLTHPRWSVRLGAMVTAEYLADESPALAIDLCRSLWQTFSDIAPQAQGDVTHIFGLIDDDTTRRYLQSIVGDDFEKAVREAAQEALAGMRG